MKAEQLRKSILQLAIQGKLVPQDPNDEPASVLLERIRTEKQKLIKEGKIKKDKGDSVIFRGDDNRHYEKFADGTVKCIEDEIDFELPEGWQYIRLSNIAYLGSGFTPAQSELCQDGTIPYFKVSDMNTVGNEKYISITQQYYVGDKIKKIFSKNTIIFPKNGGAVFTNKKRILAQDSIIDLNTGAFIPYGCIDIEYAYVLFSTIDFRKHYKGTALPTINTDFMDNLIFGLPPISEQKRIVKAIEQISPLIAKYNRLEQQATKLDNEIYDNLKKSILQYAIQGKLVPQDPNDEPAEELLKRIRAEKKAQLGKKYVESYIYKGDDNCYYEHINGKDVDITEEIPFDLPNSWEICRLNSICSKIVDGDHNPPKGENFATAYLMLSSQNINNDEIVQLDKVRYLTKEIFEIENERTRLSIGDILFTSVGTLGRSCIYKGGNNICLQRSVSVITTDIYGAYLKRFFDSPYFQNIVAKEATGTAQKGFYLNQLANSLIIVPPLAEQKRIVEKIDEILAKL